MATRYDRAVRAIDRQAAVLVKQTNVPMPASADPFAGLAAGSRVRVEAVGGWLYPRDSIDGIRERFGRVEGIYRRYILVRFDSGVPVTIQCSDVTSGKVRIEVLAGKEESMPQHLSSLEAPKLKEAITDVKFERPAPPQNIEPLPAQENREAEPGEFDRWTPDCGLTQRQWLEKFMTVERYRLAEGGMTDNAFRMACGIQNFAAWRRWLKEHDIEPKPARSAPAAAQAKPVPPPDPANAPVAPGGDGDGFTPADDEPVPLAPTERANEATEPEQEGAACPVPASLATEFAQFVVRELVPKYIDDKLASLRKDVKTLRSSFESLAGTVVEIQRIVGSGISDAQLQAAIIEAIQPHWSAFAAHRHQVGAGHYSEIPDTERR